MRSAADANKQERFILPSHENTKCSEHTKKPRFAACHADPPGLACPHIQPLPVRALPRNLEVAEPGAFHLSCKFTRVAVLIDLSFFLDRYKLLRREGEEPLVASDVARQIQRTAQCHVDPMRDELHRVFVYDCKPLGKRVHNPVTGRAVDFSRTPTYRFRTQLLAELTRMRKLALRVGELADRRRWKLRAEVTRRLLARSMTVEQLTEADVVYDTEQKGVDVKLALDIAALAYKRLVDRIVLVTGDSDFVPAAKLARREGLDVILDSLWAPVLPSLIEHVDGLRTHWPRERPATSSSA